MAHKIGIFNGVSTPHTDSFIPNMQVQNHERWIMHEIFHAFCNFFQFFPVPAVPESIPQCKRGPAEFLHQFSPSEYGFFVKKRETAKFDISGVDKPAVWG